MSALEDEVIVAGARRIGRRALRKVEGCRLWTEICEAEVMVDWIV